MSESFVFTLVPNEGQLVRFDALEAAVVEMRRLVRDVDHMVLRADGGRLRDRRWFIQQGPSRAASVALVAEDGNLSHHTDDTILDGIAAVVSGDADAPPPFFTESELLALIALRRRVLSRDVAHIEVRSGGRDTAVRILPTVEDQVNRILCKSTQALGSLDGEVATVSVGKNPSFTMWEAMTGLPVRCHFDASRLDEVKALLRERVRVTGLISYFANGSPRAVTNVELVRGLMPGAVARTYKDFWASVPKLGDRGDNVVRLKEAFGDR